MAAIKLACRPAPDQSCKADPSPEPQTRSIPGTKAPPPEREVRRHDASGSRIDEFRFRLRPMGSLGCTDETCHITPAPGGKGESRSPLSRLVRAVDTTFRQEKTATLPPETVFFRKTCAGPTLGRSSEES